jgi:hypothetical protein
MDHIWAVIILVCLALILGYEFYALFTGRQTLSSYTVHGCRQYPLIPFFVGMVVGGLAVHFWLPWCPDDCPPVAFLIPLE